MPEPMDATDALFATDNFKAGELIGLVTSTDLLAFWTTFYDLDEKHDPEAMRGAVISFFSLCEAAELGTLTLGKRGHTTRLRVDHEERTRVYESRLVAEI